MSTVTKDDIINAIANGTLTDTDLNDITHTVTTKKLKVNLITINQAGDVIKYSNNTTTPNTDIFDGANGVPTQKRRFDQNITIRCKTTDENAIISQLVPIINQLGNWGYVITSRQRNIDQTDASKITNVLSLEKRPIDL